MALYTSMKRARMRPYLTILGLATLLVLFLLSGSPTPSTFNPPDLLSNNNLTSTSSSPSTQLDCLHPIRLGDDYGGWELCRPIPPEALNNQLVYTVGIGRNIKWDTEMIAKYHTIHHGWDPTPTAADHFSKHAIPDNFYFHRIGLGAKDGNLTLKLPRGNGDSFTIMQYTEPAKQGTVTIVPILSVESMMKMLAHSHLAILKIDIEGAEFDVIKQWLEDDYTPPADQILIEFHERYFSHVRNRKSLVKNAISAMDKLGFKLVTRTKLECTFARRQAIASFPTSIFNTK